MRRRKIRKATNQKMTLEYLAIRKELSTKAGYEPQKWVLFCEFFLQQGLKVELYEARQTFSKYVTLSLKGRQYKVRFSNHKPIKHREIAGDCDFFVGITHTGTRTSKDAAKAALEFFGITEIKKAPLPLSAPTKPITPKGEYCKKPVGMTDEEARQLVPF